MKTIERKMILLDSTIAISQQVIVTIIISIIGFFGVLVTLLHKDMTSKITDAKDSVLAVHNDLKPLTIQVALHEEKIKELTKETKQVCSRLENHEVRIDELQKIIRKS